MNPPRQWCIDHGDGWKDPKCPVCFSDRNKVYEGVATKPEEIDGLEMGGIELEGGSAEFTGTLLPAGCEGKRVRITVEVLDDEGST